MLRRILWSVGAICALLLPLLSESSRAASGDIVLTATNAIDLHGHWSRAADSTAAGGILLTSTDTGWQNTVAASPTPSHYVDFTFTPQPNTPYRIWLRMRARAGSKYNDSVFVQFSNARDLANVARYRLGTTESLVVNRQACNGCALNAWGWYNDAYWLTQPSVLVFSVTASQTLRVQTREDGVEIDEIILSPVTFLNASPGRRDNDTITVASSGNGVSTPASGTPIALPGSIPADAFDAGGAGVAYHDATPGDSGNSGRGADVDLKRLASGAYAITGITAGEWVNYSVDVAAAGDYIIEADVSSAGANSTLHINVGNENVTGVLSVPITGDSPTPATLVRRVPLNAGRQTLRVIFDGNPSNSASLWAIRVRPHTAMPFFGTSVAVPGLVRAAEFDNGGQSISSYDTTAGNAGGQFRTGDVDIYGDANTAVYIGNMADGEWLEYGITVQRADNYVIHLETASAQDGARIQVQFPTGATESLAVPNTGSGNTATWTTVSTTAALAAGPQIMRLVVERGGGSLRSIRIERAARTWLVAAGGNLQQAINDAAPGDTILLQAGATYVGNFRLPVKTGDQYVTIRTSTPDALLPDAATRIAPAHADLLPKLRSPNGQPALATDAYAHHYRIQLIEFLANVNGAGNIVALGDATAAQNSSDVVPHHLVLDRVYIHGDVTLGQKRGIALNSAHTTVVNSYVSEIKAVGQDSQAIGGWNGPGPFTISNNYLEAAGENVMFGGSDPAIPGLVPSDITFTRNYLSKPWSWRGTAWTVKNIFELKNAQRVLIDGNLMENNWLAAQAGYAVLLKSVNQDGAAPWSVVQDVTFTNNIVRHVSSALNILGRDTRYPALMANNIVIRNNLFTDVSATRYGGAGRFLQISGGTNITIDHNTAITDGATVVAPDVSPTLGFAFTNNVLLNNVYGIKGSGTASGNATIATYFPNGQFFGGIYVGAKPAQYPTGNFYPATVDSVGFADFLAGDYRLAPTSIYVGGATDGTDPGVNHSTLQLALTPVR
jgi:hypothetical protein